MDSMAGMSARAEPSRDKPKKRAEDLMVSESEQLGRGSRAGREATKAAD